MTLVAWLFQGANNSANDAFGSLESIWGIDHHEFSSDSYARLTAAELRLTEIVTCTHYLGSSLPIPRHPQPANPDPPANVNLPQGGLPVIDVESARILAPDEKVPLFKLRARYSRALARTAILLFLHVNDCVHISAHSLAYLLDSLCHAAQCADLNPESHMSTSLPQSEHGALPEFRVILHGLGVTHYLPPTNIGEEEGIISGLVGVLSSPGIEQNSPVEIAAANTLTILGPMLFRQWLQGKDKYSVHIPNKEAISQGLDRWPANTNRDKLLFLPIRTLSQLLAVAAIAITQAGNPDVAELPEIAIAALYHRASMPSARGFLHVVAEENRDLIMMLLRYADLNHAKLPKATLEHCLQIFLIVSQTGLLSQSISSASLLTFLRLLAKVPERSNEMRIFFAGVQRLLLLNPSGDDYLGVFTRQSQGFVALGQIAARPEYLSVVVEFIYKVFEVAVDLIVKHPGEICYHPTPAALPGLLHVVLLVVQSGSSGAEELAHLVPFMRNAMTLLGQIQHDDLIAIADRAVVTGTNISLASALEREPRLADAADQWEKRWGLCADGAIPGRFPNTQGSPILASEGVGETDTNVRS